MSDSKTTYLTALTEGRTAGAIPAWLRAEARKVARRYDGQLQAEDLEQAFLESILVEGARNRARVPWHLHTEQAAMAMVRRRMGQLACEQVEGWNEYRSLRAHVAAVLETRLPMPPAAQPSTLLHGDRLSRQQVALATAWCIAHEHVPAEVRAVTATLRRTYLLQWAPSVEEPAFERAADDELLADEGVEFAEVVDQVVRRVGADDVRLVMRRLCNHGLKDLGAELGLSTTTVFEKARKAEARVVLAFKEGGSSERLARRALGRLMESYAA